MTPVSVPLAFFPVSVLSLRGIKPSARNALAAGHQHVSTRPETPAPAGLYPDSRNSSSQQEPAHRHMARELSSRTNAFFTFDYDKEQLKDFSTASTAVQGAKPMLLPRTGARVPWGLSTPAAGRRRLEARSPLFPP